VRRGELVALAISSPVGNAADRVAAAKAVKALQSAADNASDFGEAVWDKATDVVDVFRSIDIDGDGIPDEARALTAARRAGSVFKGAAVGSAGAVGSLFKRKGHGDGTEAAPPAVAPLAGP
jgi:hypothetical protein